jgi:hypothetical protein
VCFEDSCGGRRGQSEGDAAEPFSGHRPLLAPSFIPRRKRRDSQGPDIPKPILDPHTHTQIPPLRIPTLPIQRLNNGLNRLNTAIKRARIHERWFWLKPISGDILCKFIRLLDPTGIQSRIRGVSGWRGEFGDVRVVFEVDCPVVAVLD